MRTLSLAGKETQKSRGVLFLFQQLKYPGQPQAEQSHPNPLTQAGGAGREDIGWLDRRVEGQEQVYGGEEQAQPAPRLSIILEFPAFLPNWKAFLFSSRNLGGTTASIAFIQASSGMPK